MKKKILIITYHFPPSQAVGGQRAANFARYLPEYGWEVQVLTIKDKYIEDSDEARLQGLENVVIHKAGKLPKMMELYHLAKRVKKRIVPVKDTGTAVESVGRHKEGAKESIRQRLKRYFSSLFLALPDFERNWVLPATFRAIQIVRREKIDLIMTSCPPYSVHLIGLLVNMFNDVRWIADYRDPWYVASRKIMYPTCTLSRKIEGLLERQVVRSAAVVLCNTQRLKTTFEQCYVNTKKSGFYHIPNGISTEVFQGLQDLDKYETFTLSYTGSLYFMRSPEPIFRAFNELLDCNQVTKGDFRIKLVGQCERVEGVATEELVSSYGLEGYVEIVPPVPYLRSLEIIKKSHIALLFAPNQPYQIPAKVYDYMVTGTYILALAGDGATADLLKETATGEVFAAEDHHGITTFLAESVSNRPEIQEEHVRRVVKKFDRRKVAGDLAKMLEEEFPAD